MKIRSVKANNHRRAFNVLVGARSLWFPYAKCEPSPAEHDGVVKTWVDPELGREGFGYRLASGREGAVHLDQVLEYNRDPGYMREALLHRLTLDAQRRVAASPLSKREITRRLGTSATQFYRLLDQTNYSKSLDQLLLLFEALDCEVRVTVRARSA